MLGLLYIVPQEPLYELVAVLHIAHDTAEAITLAELDMKGLAMSLGRYVMFNPSPSLDILSVRRDVLLMSDIFLLLMRCFPAIFQVSCLRLLRSPFTR